MRDGGRPLAVTTAGAFVDEPAEVVHLGQTVGARERREGRGDQRQVEGGGSTDLGGQLHDARVAGEAAALLGTGAEVGTGRRRQPRVELGQAAPGPHGGQRGGQAALGRRGVVGVGGGDATDVVAGGQLGQGVVAGRVERVAVVPQLDEDAVAPEGVDQPVQLAAGSGRAVVDECPGHGSLAAAGQRPHVAGGVAGDVGQRELRRPLLPCQVAEAERAGQAAVAGGAVGQQQQVVAVGVGGVVVGDAAGGDLGERVALVLGRAGFGGQAGGEGDLGAEHGRQADGPGRFGEPDDAVEAVVVGEGEGVEAQAGGLGGQLLGVGGTVEEREVGVAVQLGVGITAPVRRSTPYSPGSNGWRLRLHAGPSPPAFHDGLPGARPSRPVPPRAGQGGLELGPGPRRVVEAHSPQYRTPVRRTQVRQLPPECFQPDPLSIRLRRISGAGGRTRRAGGRPDRPT